MRVNVARVWEDADYAKVRAMCDSNQEWTEVYNKKEVTVYTQIVSNNYYQMIKVITHLPDVCSSTAYDVLHDPLYRSTWDRHMTGQSDIGMINPNNDISYYSLSSIPPIRPRDFVIQRSWLDTEEEKMICSHSVCHEDFPPIKGYIRGTVFLSAYLIRPVMDGCHITYLSHYDPRGKLPTWLVNRLTKVIAPKVIKKLQKACKAYPEWKKSHQPHWKPWTFSEQNINSPRIDLTKCQPQEYNQEIIDESHVSQISEYNNEDGD